MFKWIIKLFQKLYCKIPIFFNDMTIIYIKRYMYLKKSLPFWHHFLRYKMQQTTNFIILGLNVLLEIKKKVNLTINYYKKLRRILNIFLSIHFYVELWTNLGVPILVQGHSFNKIESSLFKYLHNILIHCNIVVIKTFFDILKHILYIIQC